MRGISRASSVGVRVGPGRLSRSDRAVALIVLSTGILGCAYFLPLIRLPLWFDEQWRAFQVMSFSLSDKYAPLTPAWLILERLTAGVLGAHDWSLRLPMAFAVPLLAVATYGLGSQILPRVAALVGSLALLINGAIWAYGLQLKAFVWEALIATLLLLWWHLVHEWTGLRRLGGYIVLAVLASMGLSAAFVLVPLLGYELAHALLRRRWGQLAAIFVAAALFTIHFAVFIQSQTTSILQSAYWRATLMPHGAAGIGFLVRGTASYFPGVLTGAAGFPDFPTEYVSRNALTGLLLVLAGVAMATGAALGGVALYRHPLGGALITVLAGSLALEAIASWLRLWPYGFVRVNIFTIPLWYVLVAAGLLWVGGLIRRASRPAVRFPVALVAVCLGVPLGVLLFRDAWLLPQIRRAAAEPALDQAVQTIVATARNANDGNTLAVVDLDGHLGFGPHAAGWWFYMNDFAYPTPISTWPKISDKDSLASDDQGLARTNGSLYDFLMAHPSADRVVVFNSYGVGDDVTIGETQTLTQLGFAYVSGTTYYLTGRLNLYRR